MTLSGDISTTSTALSNIKNAIIAKGVTPTGNITTYATAISNISGGSSIPLDSQSPAIKYNYIIRKGNDNISFEQVQLTDDFQTYYDMSGDETEIDTYVSDTYTEDTDIVNLCLGAVTTVSCNNAFYNPNGYFGAFQDCDYLTSVDLSSLTTISGEDAFNSAFLGCNNLTSVDLSSLTTITGNNGMWSAFSGCDNLAYLNFPNLNLIAAQFIFAHAFEGSSIQELYFPALTSTSFWVLTNQFDDMLLATDDVTVHFPSNLQNMLSQWFSVMTGFGGDNTTVLFDLPATT